MRSHVLEFSGGEAWHRGVRFANKALRHLCTTKEMRDALMIESVREFKRGLRDALRKRAMEMFKRGMGFHLLYDDEEVRGRRDAESAGMALVMRAAAAGLRPAMAECFLQGWGISQDYDKAATLWQAELDDSASETEASGGACCWSAWRLAYCYRYGHGVVRDLARTFELYTHAAETDENGCAMYRLYQVYRLGHLGQAVDHARSVSWLRKSVDTGCLTAFEELPAFLSLGELGVDADLKEALRYYEKAKEHSPELYEHEDYEEAITKLSVAIAEQYERGEVGVDVDLKEALRYYEKAEEHWGGYREEITRVRAAIAEQSDLKEALRYCEYVRGCWGGDDYDEDIARVRAAIAAQSDSNSDAEE